MRQILSRRSFIAAAPAAFVARPPCRPRGNHLDATLLVLREPFDRTWRVYDQALAVHSAAEASSWRVSGAATDDPVQVAPSSTMPKPMPSSTRLDGFQTP